MSASVLVLGYQAIADYLGLSRSMVKTLCSQSGFPVIFRASDGAPISHRHKLDLWAAALIPDPAPMNYSGLQPEPPSR